MIELFQMVLKIFDGDERKMLLWFNTDNPMLGNVKPIELMLMGKAEKVRQFIEDSSGQKVKED